MKFSPYLAQGVWAIREEYDWFLLASRLRLIVVFPRLQWES